MDEEAAMRALAMPKRPINFVPAAAGDILHIGSIVCRIMEDGSNTDNRIGSAEFTVPPKTPGPPPHWHEMHDETFLVTSGTIRFHGPEGKSIDAKAGDYVVVPTCAPHTFENAGDEEAKFFNTFTPAHYVNYFKLLSTMLEAKGGLPREVHLEAMSRYATLPAKDM
ncbi:RmlC-like cupin domain-containing protein [Pseudomassariella vexata]|uniref:RmlC-like cupin domain-containing protein n=1 Tax=Pseudomassariella vexata TaxID=1141098 RepID=A0A1Y2EIB0_9PEZI|nr:RmlC-like cupin domain-containing protein [Pseudomassariella vexata]ORY71321.1 RmlC-like cupin domain-containing protein [Pseudomassariella vexata]